MDDMDTILSIIENSTRRKILQAVVREPHYPLQLSKELGISQQAVVKNLNLMEKEGLVESYRESSDRGPERIFYRPSSEFSITIDMRNNMFDVKLITVKAEEPKNTTTEEAESEAKRLEEVRAQISQIDRQIAEFDRRRAAMVRERDRLISEFMNSSPGLDYVHRELLYDMLNRPNWGADDISRNLGFNEKLVSQMIDEVLLFCRQNQR